MKLSTIAWLSKTIALPLFMGLLNILPAGAEQIARSRSSVIELLPSVTDLNLSVPVTANPSSLDRPEASDSIKPIWSHPNSSTRKNSSSTVRREQPKKAKLIANSGESLPSNTRSGGDRSNRKNLTARNTDASSELTGRDGRRSRSNSRKDIAAISQPPLSGNYFRLVRDPNKGTNDMGNPIYILEAYVRGEKYQTFNSVSGTVKSQSLDRNLGENAAPLPDGKYGVSNQIVPGTLYEVGKTFIAIYPLFKTARIDLGIHLDRSFNQPNGFDGTAGCIGIATIAERNAVNEFITKYRPRNLFVNIES
ncbi:MAG: hypothetical protein LH474_01175 [Chamaesiphon sp.]|nr:hypothetical protein [Chamaesiphon sp.]